jgi:YegS/Rv2252/BmrU family lipid kinase
MRSGVAVILNLGAGSVEGNEQIEDVRRAFLESGVHASFHIVEPGREIADVVQDATNSDATVIVAGGGDGTISLVASCVAQKEKILGVLPLGTLNHFSKDLEIPQEVIDAVKIISFGEIREVDIAEVNGRYFVNNSSIGLYPRLVLTRERRQRLGYGKWGAALWALTRMVRWSPFQNVKLELDGNELRRKTAFVFVGNNEYEMDIFNIGTRERLDGGKLSIYLLHRSGRTGLFLLVLRTIFGTLKQASDFEEFRTDQLTIETRRTRMLVALDGEVARMESPLEYKIHPRKLRVLVPNKEQ